MASGTASASVQNTLRNDHRPNFQVLPAIVGGSSSLVVNGLKGTAIFGGSCLLGVEGSTSGAASMIEGGGSVVYDVIKGVAGSTNSVASYDPAKDRISLFGHQHSNLSENAVSEPGRVSGLMWAKASSLAEACLPD